MNDVPPFMPQQDSTTFDGIFSPRNSSEKSKKDGEVMSDMNSIKVVEMSPTDADDNHKSTVSDSHQFSAM